MQLIIKVTSLVIVCLFAMVLTGRARHITATSNGNWENNATWGGTAPACGDTIYIASGRTVQITSVLDFSLCVSTMQVVIDGSLSFQTGKKLRLNCSSAVVVNNGGWIISGGGGGNSNLIEICTSIVWNTAMGNLPGPVTLAINPLPVSMAYFTATAEEDHVFLEWITYTEVNNECFFIEKSTDGKVYNQIGKINGAGTSSNQLRYSFKDKMPKAGIQYYRLLQRDYDGKITYFKPVALRWEDDPELAFYPNPARGELFMTLPESFANRTVRLLVRDMHWGIVFQKDIAVDGKVSGIQLLSKSEPLKPGNYLVTLGVDEQKFTRIIMIQ
jgi:hypothetical protein